MTSSDIASSVRHNTGSAAVAALCLIFFGFFGFFAIPSISDLFTLGDALFNYTLRGGGLLMAVVAVWSYCGRVTALLADAMVSTAIGMALILSGMMMIGGSGGIALNYVLYAVFGAMFVSAGVRNGREYVELARSSAFLPSDRGEPQDAAYPMERHAPPSATPGPSLASQLRHRIAGQATDAHRGPTHTEPPLPAPRPRNVDSPGDVGLMHPPAGEPVPPGQSSVDRPPKPDSKPAHDGEPPPDGYLASFADDGPPAKG